MMKITREQKAKAKEQTARVRLMEAIKNRKDYYGNNKIILNALLRDELKALKKLEKICGINGTSVAQ